MIQQNIRKPEALPFPAILSCTLQPGSRQDTVKKIKAGSLLPQLSIDSAHLRAIGFLCFSRAAIIYHSTTTTYYNILYTYIQDTRNTI